MQQCLAVSFRIFLSKILKLTAMVKTPTTGALGLAGVFHIYLICCNF